MISINLRKLTGNWELDKKSYNKNWKTYPKVFPVITNLVWSPIIFKEGRRKSSNFVESYYCGLDLDEGRTLDDVFNTFEDMKHIIATTKRHTPEHHRLRIVIPWTEPIRDRDVYIYNMTRLIERHDCDQKCKDAARLFWPCKNIVSFSFDGYTQDVKIPQKRKKSYVRPTTQGLPVHTLIRLNNVIPVGNRNNAVYGIAKDLAKVGKQKAEILDIICNSATYKNSEISFELKREIEQTIYSAIGAVNGGINDGQNKIGRNSAESTTRDKRNTSNLSQISP